MSITSQILSLEEARDDELNTIREECDNGTITPEQRDACLDVYAQVYAEKIAAVLSNKNEPC